MTNSERFDKLLSFSPDIDRTPVVEWAGWWDKTIANWRAQGLSPNAKTNEEIRDSFGLDRLRQFWLPVRERGCPSASFHGGPIIYNEADYNEVKRYLYTDELLRGIEINLRSFREEFDESEYPCWFSVDGFFWFPRTLFGIENHLLAFYDYPDLMKTMNEDLCAYHKRCLEVVFSIVTPKFMTFGEDMSYNLGPMLSKPCYDEFILPYYKTLVPLIKAGGTKVLIDTDGNVEPLIPWFLEGGIEGILPLERMAGVDVNRIRERYPSLIMIGGYDKTVMHRGEAAMRAEFERLLPVIRSGGYIPAVDHQTPPEVSVDDYRLYVRLLREYAQKAARRE